MQDKQWDERFEDHAWSKMRRLLDREMPVAGARRRRFASLALLLLLLGSTAVGWYWWQSQPGNPPLEERSIENTAANDQPIAEGEASTSGNNASKIQNTEPDRIGKASIPTTEAPIESAAGDPAASRNTTPERDRDTVSGGRTSPSGLTSTDTPTSPVDRLESKLPNALSKIEKDLTLPNPEIAASAAVTGISKLATLKPQKIPTQEFPLPLPDEGFSAKPTFFLLPNEWGVQGTVLANTNNLPGGMALGLTGGYRFGNSRWSLHTGIQYRYDEQDFFRENRSNLPNSRGLTTGEANNPTTPNTDTADFGGGTGSQGSGNIQLPGDGQLGAMMQNLNLPVLLQYRLGNRFSVHSGMQINYLLAAAQRSTLDYNTNVFANLQDQNLSRLLSTQADQSFDKSLLHQFDIELSTGLHFRLDPQWRLHLRYHYGLTDIVRSSYYQSHNRYLGFGMTYYLK